ncbi:MAG: energy transducer TonB [Rhodobacterales bacterium]|nr:energy transducer TonB [Rhodobacterales bacterium]
MVNTGYYISGVGHAGLIGLLLFGGMPVSDPDPIEVSDVSIISSEEFAMLIATSVPPVTDSVEPQGLQQPEIVEDAPDVSEVADTPPPVVEPDVTESEPPDDAPVAPEITPPAPDVTIEIEPVIAPPSDPVTPVIPTVPTAVRPQVRPAPRVAPVPVAPPEPDVAVDDVVRETAVPDAVATEQTPEDQATAPQEAATRIVPEDEQAQQTTSAAPTRSARPRSRPSRPNRPNPSTAQTNNNAAAIAAAVAAQASSAPSGPPLTNAEENGLRRAVSECWVVDVGGRSANVSVTLGFSLDRAGKIIGGTLRLIRSEGASGAAADTAFNAARRAVLRCQKGGYKLPVDKYDHWREIEMTFNPEKMRIK